MNPRRVGSIPVFRHPRGPGVPGRGPAPAGTVAAPLSRWGCLVAALLAFAPASGRAEPWREVFAAERDSAFFLLEDGTVLRAPFGLGTAETLWRCPAGQRVVRLLGSPRGGRLAFTSRGIETDTTRLWIASPRGVELRLRYFSLQAKRHSQTYSEISWPTTADVGATGARLLSPTFRPPGPSSNALAWTPEGRLLYVGYDGGIAGVVPERSGVTHFSGHRALWLRPLRPSPLLAADALDSASASSRELTQFDLEHALDHPVSVKEGRIADVLERRRMLLAPAGWRLRECDAEGWWDAGVRAAGERRLWWAAGRGVKALDVASCSLAAVLPAPGPVGWLAYDESGKRLLGLSGRVLWRADEAGATITPVLRAASGVRRVLRAARGPAVLVVAKDSVLVWDSSTGEVRRHRYDGETPDLAFEGDSGQLVLAVAAVPGRPMTLARATRNDADFRPVPVPAAARWGSIVAGPRGAWVLCCDIGRRAPEVIHAFGVESGRWHVAENPGITAWEPLNH